LCWAPFPIHALAGRECLEERVNVDLIDLIFYGVGRLTQMALNRLGIPIRNMGDGGYTVLGLFIVVGVFFLIFIFWTI
jgi:hypothetical protein